MPTFADPLALCIRPQSESKELCYAKLHFGEDGVTVLNAEFIQTKPPNSIRILLKLEIQLNKRVRSPTGGYTSRPKHIKPFVVEFLEVETVCESCGTGGVVSNPDQWVACVQVRDHVAPLKGSYFYLDRLIIENDASLHRAIKINQLDHGRIDVFFLERSHGVDFVEFIRRESPVKIDDNININVDNPAGQYTFSVEIPPIFQNDLICLPPEVVLSLGNFGPIVICTGMTKTIALIDPFTLRRCNLDADQYWGAPFKPLRTRRHRVAYTVLDGKIIDREDINNRRSRWYALAEVRVARVSDNKIFCIKTHIGPLLSHGIEVLGYDLSATNDFDPDQLQIQQQHKGLVLPEAVLIRISRGIPHIP